MMKSSLTVLFLFCVAKCYGVGFVTLSDTKLGDNCYTENSVKKCAVTRGSMENFSCTFTLNGSPIVNSTIKFAFTGEAAVTHRVCRTDDNQLFLSDNICAHTDIPIGTFTLQPSPVLVSSDSQVPAKVFSFRDYAYFADGSFLMDSSLGNLECVLQD